MSIAVAGLALALLPAAASGAGTTPCKPGQGRLVLQGKPRCVAPGALLPAPTPAASSAAQLTRYGIDRKLPAALQKRLAPRRWRKAPAPKVAAMAKRLRARVGPFGAAVESRATAPFTSRVRAVTLNEGPTSVTTTADGRGISAKGSITATDSEKGTSATLDLGATATAEGRLDLDIGMTIRDRDKGSSSSTSLSMPIIRKDEVAEVCPSATGVIRRVRKLDLRRTTREQRTLVGLDYRNESLRASATVTMTGQVDRGAVLRSIKYEASYDYDWSFAASVLRGVGRGNVQLQIKTTASGTIDGPTGTRTGGATTISGSYRDIANSAKQDRAAFAKTIGDAATRAKILELVTDLVDSERQALKKAEAAWQQPGACASMTLDPASGTLEDGDTTDVHGTVRAKDGTPADADWTLATRTRGEVATLPGTSSADTPIALSMTGEAPASGTRTVDVLLRATSPAGVAQAPWTAESVRHELYFRVVGGSGSMTAGGSRTQTNTGCTIDQTADVGPSTYSFAKTSGPPDGSVSVDEFGGSGSVRGSGDSTRPAFTWRKTCPPAGPSTQPVAALTFSGRFGPTVSFFPVAGAPTLVEVVWDVLSPPPIYGYDIDDVDCRPVPGDRNFYAARIPLSTLEQTTPFTLSIDASWAVDADRAGPTSCTGDTQQSLTLQRVAADGSALARSRWVVLLGPTLRAVSPVDVVHFTDPGCPWAYSASPDLAVLQWRYRDQLRWRLVTIGLAERAEQYEQRGYTPGASAQGRAAFRRFGMPLSPTVRPRLMGTARGCRAIVATRQLVPEREHAVFRALQFTYFTTAELMDTDEGIRAALATVPDLDAEAVIAALDSDDVTNAYEADRAEARTAAGTPTEAQGKAAATDGPVRYTAPSLVFRQGDRCLEAGGFQSLEAYDVCLANLDTSLERRAPAATAAEALSAFPHGLTTQEVAAVMTPDLSPRDRRAAELALLGAQADGEVDRRPLGDDALWTLRDTAANRT